MIQTELVPALEPESGVLGLIPPARARQYASIPLRRRGSRLIVAMSDPDDLAAVGDLEFLTGCTIDPVGVARETIARAIDLHYPNAKTSATSGRSPSGGNQALVVGCRVPPRKPASPAVPAVRLQRMIFEAALMSGASDIHIDPGDRWTRVRFRIDGAISDRFDLPRWLHSRLIARVKVLARLDISERRRPQDGLVVDPAAGVEGRVSTLPTEKGEAAVVRLFRDRKSPPSLGTLGAGSNVESRLRAMCNRPQGMLLVSGPTGSGKTTTLYAVIDELRRRPLNIMTIEDPVEYRLDGIRQVQVDSRSGLTFHSALRATLRQDPDVILVGEIRDRETASIAFEAALTGHLVLSTLHANDAISVIGRLLELGVDRGIVAEALVGSVAQRLVRLNCGECLRADRPEDLFIERLGLEAAVGKLGRSAGCPACDFTRSSGRKPFFEVIELATETRSLLRDGDIGGFRRSARLGGRVPILDQVLDDVRDGRIAAEEAYRTCYFGGAA
jgi:type IV pilus assembly protein PilB